MVLWAVASVSLFIAAAALWVARRTARRLDALTQSYWELRYDYTRLRAVVSRLDIGDEQEPSAPAPQPPVSFVPLSSMKKKNG